MEEINFLPHILYGVGGLLLVGLVFAAAVTVDQGTIAVVTRFGKYLRLMRPGLGFKIPLIDQIYDEVSIQNQAAEMKFQAITVDQANVYFKTMLLYAAFNSEEETIKKVAFKFASEEEFNMALTRTIEGSVRSFVASKRQAEILTLRREIIEYVKKHIDTTLEDWGYHLLDLQVNDITFDGEIMTSMSRVVAANNLKAAAENEGQALLIQKTKEAEANGNAIKIQAGAEKEAATLRGEGVANFRKAVAEGLKDSVHEVGKEGMDVGVIMFTMWTEAIKNFAEVGRGNIIFLDGSQEGMQRTVQGLLAMQDQQTNGANERKTKAS